MKNKRTHQGDNRFYHIDGEYYPSVTTILNVYPKGEHLVKWIADQGYEQAKQIKEEAGEKGIIIHESIELLIAGKELSIDNFDLEVWKKLLSFKAFWMDYRPITTATEMLVYSKEYKFAGTLDWVGTLLFNGEQTPAIIDWKSSRSLHEIYDLQLAAYTKAYEEMGNIAPEKILIVQLGSKTKKGFTVHEVKNLATCFAGFLVCLDMWSYLNPNPKHKEEVLPTTLKL